MIPRYLQDGNPKREGNRKKGEAMEAFRKVKEEIVCGGDTMLPTSALWAPTCYNGHI